MLSICILLLTFGFPFNTHSFYIIFFGTRTRNFKNKNYLINKNMNNCGCDCNCYNNIINNVSFKNNTEINSNNSKNFKIVDDSWDDGEIPWDVDMIVPSKPFH